MKMNNERIKECRADCEKGLYSTAIDKINKLINEEFNDHDKIEYKEKKTILFKSFPDLEYFTKSEADVDPISSIGNAKFPVVTDKDSSIQIFRVNAGNTDSNNFRKPLDGLASVISMSEKIIQECIKDSVILNYGTSVSIRTGISPQSGQSNYEISGESFHFAALISYISYYLEIPIPTNYFFTGRFDGIDATEVGQEGVNTKAALIMKEQNKNSKLFLPKRNYDKSKKDFLGIELIAIESISELILKVFEKPISELIEDNEKVKAKIRKSGRIEIKDLGKIEIPLSRCEPYCKNANEIEKTFQTIYLQFIPGSEGLFTKFPLEIEIINQRIKDYDLVILEGKVPNIYTALISNCNPQGHQYIGIKRGPKDVDPIILATSPSLTQDKELLGYEFPYLILKEKVT